MPETVLITGASGLIGTRLTQLLLHSGYRVSHLSRNKQPVPEVTVYRWNVEEQFIEKGALETADYIIHLAGAGVADKRWSKARKQEILESRTQSANLLYKQLGQTTHHVKAVVSASAIGYYGVDTGDQWVSEESQAGDDFLAQVCVAWEQAVQQINQSGIRTVSLRIGIVLSDQGGALPKLVQPIKLGAGAPLGSGKQYVSWIHVDDLCRAFIHALEHEPMRGIYNAVGPEPVTNEILTRIAADVLDKPFISVHVPAFAIRLAVGEMAGSVLGGNRVANQKLVKTGFTYSFPQLKPALEDLLLR